MVKNNSEGLNMTCELQYMPFNLSNSLLLCVSKMLHSIFFLGLIHEKKEKNTFKKDEIKPKDIFSKCPELMEKLQGEHSDAFTAYNKKLPKRTPFSCFLDQVSYLSIYYSNFGNCNK